LAATAAASHSEAASLDLTMSPIPAMVTAPLKVN